MLAALDTIAATTSPKRESAASLEILSGAAARGAGDFEWRSSLCSHEILGGAAVYRCDPGQDLERL